MPTIPPQKILVFCPPFDGHLNVIKRLTGSDKCHFQWKIVITGWTNVPVETANYGCDIAMLAKSALAETDPALWTLPRAAELLEACIDIAREYQPDLIFYDFFSIEGSLVGQLLDIPAWSSIPAFMGRFEDLDYLTKKLSSKDNIAAMRDLHKRYGLTINPKKLEMISDGIHIPGEVNIVWSYPSVTPADFMAHRQKRHYVFVGSVFSPTTPNRSPSVSARPIIYLSFGTVVMNNLWNQRAEVREGLTVFFGELAKIWQNRNWDVVFVTQGKEVLTQYPKNWHVVENVNQFEVLNRSSVFVTHGGSNSFHEAILAQTPMVVVPFFGDQPLVAQTVAKLGIGSNLVPGVSIDTRAPRDYLQHGLAQAVDVTVKEILSNNAYTNSLELLNLAHTDIYSLLARQIRFEEGDLLFGTNVARQKYVTKHNLQEEFTILEFKAFAELAPHDYSLPRIIDIYHDVILNDDYFKTDNQSGRSVYIQHLREYKEFLDGETDFEKMCIKGIDYFTQYYNIHFILSDFTPSANRITKAEINYILENRHRLEGKVTFYRDVGGHWIPIPYSSISALLSRGAL